MVEQVLIYMRGADFPAVEAEFFCVRMLYNPAFYVILKRFPKVGSRFSGKGAFGAGPK